MANDEDKVDRLEVASAIVLSIAALASSWASYQAGLWDGEQAAHYTRANALRIEASRVRLEGDLVASAQMRMFDAWLQAKASRQEELAQFYQSRIPENFRPAFNAWLADKPLINPSAPQSPFVTPLYKRPGKAESDALDAQADKTFSLGQHANSISDAFQQGSTVLAIALFFGGIGQVFKQRGPRVALLTVAGLALVLGLLRISSLPLQILGLHPPAAG